MTDGAIFTDFQIKGLRGGKTVSARLIDNTLILVGENGSGKTTFLRMLFYFLSGRWSNLAEFDFATIEAKINGKTFSVAHEDLTSISSFMVDPRVVNRLPQIQRRRVNELIEQGRYSDAESLAAAYSGHLGLTPSRQNDLFQERDKKIEAIVALQEEVAETLQAQILYLPTYRRIERELSSIIQGYDPDERRGQAVARQQEDGRDYVELVEFGMNDVKRSINRALEGIRDF